ncbi:unnamed protein product, partial [Candidula unifasciata]
KMAAFTENVVKVAGIAAALPFVAVAAGFRLRFVQAKEANGSGVRRVYRVCDLPAYSGADTGDLKCDGGTSYPRNSLEAGISTARQTLQEVFGQFVHVVDNSMKITAKTSVATSIATYRYLRDNTEELSRAAVVAGAGVGGFLFANKSNPWRRSFYGFMAAVPCAIVCYPSKLMQLFQPASDYLRDAWEKDLRNHLEQKYSLGEQWQVGKIPRLQTSDNFDTISLSDFYEPDTEKLRTIDLCRADTVQQQVSTAELCHAETISTVDNVDKLSTGDFNTGELVEKPNTDVALIEEQVGKLNTGDLITAEHADNPSTGDLITAEHADNLSTRDFSTVKHVEMQSTGNCSTREQAENLSTGDFSPTEHVEMPSSADISNAGITEKLAEVDVAKNIEKPSSEDCNAQVLGELSHEYGNAEGKQKHWMVENCCLKDTEKTAKGSTDQSNPDDKDMYSTRSS